jgi:predicted nucleotidyltransferase component of viral defense system
MIGPKELERRAAALGIAVQHAELDYVLSHVVAQIARDPRALVFRGGTALARVYWPDFRISEDLDFVTSGSAPDLEGQLTRATQRAAEGCGMPLDIEVGRRRDDRIRSYVRWSTPWGSAGVLLVDVVTSETSALPVGARPLVLPYSDLDGPSIPTMDLHEILANKWLMLDDRDEPRDLFDLWWGLTRGAIRFERVADAHVAKYRYPPSHVSIQKAGRLERPWNERLSHQLARLPTFEEARSSVDRAFREWHQSEPG